MEKEIKYRGCKIKYETTGQGPCLMFIHGFTEHSGIWNDFTKELSSSFKIIAPSLPAHGGSQFPDTGLTMEFMADCIYKIVKEEKVEKLSMTGHSMGGYVLLSFAEKYPQYCKNICLFHSTARADTPNIKENRNRTIKLIKNNHSGFLHSFIPDLFAEIHRERLEEKINDLITSAKQIPAAGLIACIEAMKDRHGSIELLARINIPVAFILGKQDSRISFESVLAQTALPKKSHVLILDECGHMGYLEKRDETLAFIRYFASL
jgi:pimeloyl-ACP methyl ester carboxylesterase